MIVASEAQRESVRAAGAMLGAVLRELCERAVPGASATELDAAALSMIRARGAEPVFLGYRPEGARRAYPATLCLSVNDEVVHGIPKEERILRKGDVVSLDLGLSYRSCIVDAARTIIVGGEDAGDADARRLVAGAREALDAGIAAARPGAHVGDIGAAVSAAAQKNLLAVVRDLGGHGTGEKLHEAPFIANYGTPGQGDLLKEDMVLALEPIFTLGSGAIKLASDGWTYQTRDGSRAAHFEDTIIVGKGGTEVVTR